MTIQVGDRLPDVPLTIATADGPKPTTTTIFSRARRWRCSPSPAPSRRPARRGTCPSYVDKADELKGKGIDEIACISVNDPFVMAAWGKRRRICRTSPCSPTATATSPRRSASTMDGSKFGMGKRSQRYSMIVNDGVVEQLNVEAPGEYRASSAEYMLDQLATA